MPGCFIETLTVIAIFVSMVTLTPKLLKAFIETPPLWLDEQFDVQQFVFPEIDYRKVPNSKVPARMRLGHKMEHILKNCLKGQSVYELIAHNTAVKRDNRTIGEIDFLLKDSRDRGILHLELTYKFYLIDTAFSEPKYQLLGPNRKDKFHAKLEKLKNMQFRIPFAEEGKAQLAMQDVATENLRQEVCFKAQLFAPYSEPNVCIKPFNSHCVVGFWLPYKAFITPKFQSYEYYLPVKDEWIISPYDTSSWMSYFKLLPELKTLMFNKRSPMVWVKKKESVFEKFFITWW